MLRSFTTFPPVIVCLLVGALLTGGCKKSPPAAARPAIVVISGDTDGWIVPCGCTSNQSGGLLRRGTYLAGLRRGAEVIYADAGGATPLAAGNSPYQLAKFQAILAGELSMKISAHNLGASELAFGPAALRDLADRAGIPFVSANARAKDGKPLAPPIRIVTLAGGRRIALAGVVSPAFATDAIDVDDPRQAMLSLIAAHRGEFDSLIVLAYMNEEELEKLAAELPEADAVVGGPTGQAIVPRMVGPVLLAASTNKGKFLVQLHSPSAAGQSWTGRVDELGPAYDNDVEQDANLHLFLATLDQADFTAAQSGFAPAIPAGMPANYRIAGSVTCRSCHADAYAEWQSSGHGHAWLTLVNKEFAADSFCQQCHTTGFGLPGGFASRSESMAEVNVGCEDCHGPSLAHVQDPHVHTPYAALDQCARCHDEENSPGFVRSTAWLKIRHGKAATP